MARKTEPCSFSLNKDINEEFERYCKENNVSKSQILSDFVSSVLEQDMTDKEKLYKQKQDLLNEKKNIESKIEFINRQIERIEEHERQQEEVVRQLNNRQQYVYNVLSDRIPKLYKRCSILANGQLSMNNSPILKDIQKKDSVIDTELIKDFLYNKTANKEEIEDNEILNLTKRMFDNGGVEA